MKAANEAIRNKEMGSCTASRVFTLPQTTPQNYVKDQKSSGKAIKQNWVGSKFFPCEGENDLAEHCLLMERKFFGLTMADIMCLTYQLAVKNGIKNQFCKRNEKAGRKWLKNFLCHHPQISVTTPEGLSLSRARGFTPESVAQFFLNLRTCNGHR